MSSYLGILILFFWWEGWEMSSHGYLKRELMLLCLLLIGGVLPVVRKLHEVRHFVLCSLIHPKDLPSAWHTVDPQGITVDWDSTRALGIYLWG